MIVPLRDMPRKFGSSGKSLLGMGQVWTSPQSRPFAMNEHKVVTAINFSESDLIMLSIMYNPVSGISVLVPLVKGIVCAQQKSSLLLPRPPHTFPKSALEGCGEAQNRFGGCMGGGRGQSYVAKL